MLIGARVGGCYDQVNQVSITQREYREAYQMHLAGKLKLLNFVRSEVWPAKEDRRELASYLESIDLKLSTKRTIANFRRKDRGQCRVPEQVHRGSEPEQRNQAGSLGRGHCSIRQLDPTYSMDSATLSTF